MSIQQITNHNDAAVARYANHDNKKVKEEAAKAEANDAVIYEKTPAAEKTYKRDQATIDRLLAEAQENAQKLRDLVQRMLQKQGETFDNATNIYSLLREGKVKVDPETQAQAQKDISKDGYWGVEQTSERLVSFAKALAGGDPSKADILIKAVKKGFGEAEKTWGGKLPQICKDTLDSTISKLESWRDSLED